MTIYNIEWRWGKTEINKFNPQDDKINFNWFQKNEFKINDDNGAITVSIPSNEQKYIFEGVTLKNIDLSNIIAKDSNTLDFLKTIISGDTPAPVPPTPDPDPIPPVPPTPDPDPIPPVPPTPDPDPTPVPPVPGKQYYSPYIDCGLWKSREFPSMCQQAGIKSITLAFLVGQGDTLRWGGSGGEITEFLPQIKQAQSNGVDVVISFGGANGVDPAVSYSSAEALARDLQKVLDMGIHKLDFDVEASNVGNAAANQRRGQALTILKKNNPKLEVSFTLAVLPTGLTYDGLEIVRQAKNYGFEVDVVKVMAMDYCQGVKDMGQAAIDAGVNTLKQLKNLGLNKAKVGIIPMIGINDSYAGYGEVFTLEDAKKLLKYVKTNKEIISIGIWSLSRDNGNSPYNTADCQSSGLQIENYAFSKIFKQI